MLPWSIFAANGVREGEIFSGTESEGLHAALGQIAELAGDHLVRAETALGTLPGKLKPAFAGIALLKAQARALDRRRGGLFAPVPDEADWHKIARLAWWSWRNG
jgi:phytoene synthase